MQQDAQVLHMTNAFQHRHAPVKPALLFKLTIVSAAHTRGVEGDDAIRATQA